MCTSKHAQSNQNKLTLTYLRVQFPSRKVYIPCLLFIAYFTYTPPHMYWLYVIHTFISYYPFLFCTLMVPLLYSSRENNLHKPYKGVICWSLHISFCKKYRREKIKRERKKIVLPLEIENTEALMGMLLLLKDRKVKTWVNYLTASC